MDKDLFERGEEDARAVIAQYYDTETQERNDTKLTLADHEFVLDYLEGLLQDDSTSTLDDYEHNVLTELAAEIDTSGEGLRESLWDKSRKYFDENDERNDIPVNPDDIDEIEKLMSLSADDYLLRIDDLLMLDLLKLLAEIETRPNYLLFKAAKIITKYYDRSNLKRNKTPLMEEDGIFITSLLRYQADSKTLIFNRYITQRLTELKGEEQND